MLKWLRNLLRKEKDPPPKLIPIYCIPGFGTDDKIFGRLQIENAVMHFINWLDPLPSETYQHYVSRMAEEIKEADPVIIGVSFGGMVALEIARIRKVKRVILISSIKSRDELPAKWKLVGRLKLNKIVPIKRIQSTERFYALANKRVGAFTKDEIEFANNYRRTVKTNYMVWALSQILNWRNSVVPENIVHIHGSKDLLFPLKTSHPTHVIEGGTHMMVWNRAEEVSKIINEVLKN